MSAVASFFASEGLRTNVWGEALPLTSRSGLPVVPITWATNEWTGFMVATTFSSARAAPGMRASVKTNPSSHAALGDRDQAFQWLDRAAREHSAGLQGLGFLPEVRSLRSDPRFVEFLYRIGVDPAKVEARDKAP